MSHVLTHDGHYFRLDIIEVVRADDPEKTVYIGWCSDAFNDLKDTLGQSLSHFIAGPPLSTFGEARSHACNWIKSNWDTRKSTLLQKPRDFAGPMYTVWIFKGAESSAFEFKEFSDAKIFAQAAELSGEITTVQITSNESPQYLTMWQRKGK